MIKFGLSKGWKIALISVCALAVTGGVVGATIANTSTAYAATETSLSTGITGLSASYTAGTWSMSGTTLNGSVTDTSKKETSGCNTTTKYYSQSATLTLKNTSGAQKKLSFTAGSFSGKGTRTINGTTASAKAYSFVLGANETLTITIASGSNGATSSDTTSIALSSIALEEPPVTNVTVTLKAPGDKGSYTFNGTAVTAQKSVTCSSADVNTLVATPKSGYKFYAWYNAANDMKIGTTATLSKTFAENMTIYPMFCSTNAATFTVGSNEYADLNMANTAAASASNKTIVLASSGELDAGNYTISSGVFLLMPYNDSGSSSKASVTSKYQKSSWTTPSAFRTLTMKEGAHITVSGEMETAVESLAAVGQDSGHNGMASGAYGHVKMEEGSQITLKSGAKLYCWGYVSGKGLVEAENGSAVYERFEIRDYRGGTGTSNVYSTAFPFYQYYVQSVEASLKLYSGALEYVMGSVNTSLGCHYFDSPLVFIGKTSGMFRLTSGSLTKTYDSVKDRLVIDINGDAQVNSLKISLKVSIDTSKLVLPLNSNISINIHSGTTQIASTQKMSMLPSSEIIVDEGAILNVDSSMYMFAKADWGANVFSNKYLNPLDYTAANGTANKNIRTADGLVDAKIDVNGTLNINGSIGFSANAANLITSSENTGTINVKNSLSGSSVTFAGPGASDKVTVSFVAAKFSGIAPQKGDLLIADGGSWVKGVTAGWSADGKYYYTSSLASSALKGLQQVPGEDGKRYFNPTTGELVALANQIYQIAGEEQYRYFDANGRFKTTVNGLVQCKDASGANLGYRYFVNGIWQNGAAYQSRLAVCTDENNANSGYRYFNADSTVAQVSNGVLECYDQNGANLAFRYFDAQGVFQAVNGSLNCKDENGEFVLQNFTDGIRVELKNQLAESVDANGENPGLRYFDQDGNVVVLNNQIYECYDENGQNKAFRYFNAQGIFESVTGLYEVKDQNGANLGRRPLVDGIFQTQAVAALYKLPEEAGFRAYDARGILISKDSQLVTCADGKVRYFNSHGFLDSDKIDGLFNVKGISGKIGYYYFDKSGCAVINRQIIVCAGIGSDTEVVRRYFDSNGIYQKDFTGPVTIGSTAYFVQAGVVTDLEVVALEETGQEENESAYAVSFTTEDIANDQAAGVYEYNGDGELQRIVIAEDEAEKIVSGEKDAGSITFTPTVDNGSCVLEVKNGSETTKTKCGFGLFVYNGYYYYADSKGDLVTGSYRVSRTNGITAIAKGTYFFDEDGRLCEKVNDTFKPISAPKSLKLGA